MAFLARTTRSLSSQTAGFTANRRRNAAGDARICRSLAAVATPGDAFASVAQTATVAGSLETTPTHPTCPPPNAPNATAVRAVSEMSDE